MDKRCFTVEHTNICKGIAIFIMLFHHLFYRADSWDLYIHKIQIGSWPLLAYIATQGKICVTIFVLLSAYGLTVSLKRTIISLGGHYSRREYWKFVISRIKKLYYLYWPVFLLATAIGLVTSVGNPIIVYKSLGEYIRDLLGIAYIIDGETPFLGAWWYVSFALTLYIVFPLLYLLTRRWTKITLIIAFICGIQQIFDVPILIEWQRYLFVCCLGIFLADTDAINMLINRGKQRQRIFISGMIVCILMLLRCIHAFTLDGFLALAMIVLCVDLFESTRYIKKVLITLGKYSGTMFLTHGLLYKIYLRNFIYGFKIPVLIFTVLLVITFFLSVGIERFKVGVARIING